ncbi:hypothetical protein K438DRAFT_1758518 [Mycena galopus ATCC 62051]|nr:hypothetical protein K438DRAFT_1758518 [Mycena galopus ATCC 62051]
MRTACLHALEHGISSALVACLVANWTMQLWHHRQRFRSEYMQARSILAQIVQEVSLDRDPYNHATALYNIAATDLDLAAAKDKIQSRIDDEKSTFTTLGELEFVRSCDIVLAQLLLRDGDTIHALGMLHKILQESWGGRARTVSNCLEILGNVCHWGDLHASSWTIVFLVHSLKSKQNLEINKALQFLGDLSLSQGDVGTACSLFTAALEGFTLMDIHRSRAECMLRLGEISEGQDDLDRVAEHWHIARPLFEQSSQMKGFEDVNSRLATIDEKRANGVLLQPVYT